MQFDFIIINIIIIIVMWGISMGDIIVVNVSPLQVICKWVTYTVLSIYEMYNYRWGYIYNIALLGAGEVPGSTSPRPEIVYTPPLACWFDFDSWNNF